MLQQCHYNSIYLSNLIGAVFEKGFYYSFVIVLE